VRGGGIKAAKLKRLPLAVPPLAEQRRIVSEVSRLNALCEQLKQGLGSVRGTRSNLLKALLSEALKPAVAGVA
jgi:type I restriction enzyme S subunit